MEMERLQQQYNLAPGREARRIQEEQFNKSLAQQNAQYEQNRSDAKMAGITGTIANVGTTAGMMRAMTKGPNEPFFGQTATNLWDKAWGNTPKVATPGMTPAVAGYSATPGGMTGINGVVAGSPEEMFVVNPATMPEATAGVGMGTAGYGAQGGIGTGIGAAESAVMEAAPWVAGGYLGGKALEATLPTGTFGHRAGETVADVISWPGKLLTDPKGAVKEAGKFAEDIAKPVVDFISDPIGGISDMFGW